jgi:hypothetical protein
VSVAAQPSLPFRWDLITPDRFGTLLDGAQRPNLWFVDDLVACAGTVLARSGNGDLFFVGRSLDSMFDLLGGALHCTAWRGRLYRLPLSFAIPGQRVAGRWRPGRISQAELQRARGILEDLGLSPYALARRRLPATFVDVVHGGSTFTRLFDLLRSWIESEREPWQVIRRKLRFIGVTSRTKTSPNTFRWQQHADWTASLPARSVLNVSLDRLVWSYLGDRQVKLTRTFRPQDWLADQGEPRRGEDIGAALTEARALVEYGRSRDGRRALAAAMVREPAMAAPWLRALLVQLTAG